MKSIKEIKIEYLEQMEAERKQQLQQNSHIIDEFILFCAGKGIKLKKKNFDFIEPIGIVAKFPDLLNKLNNELIKNDEELISCKLLKRFYNKKSLDNGLLHSHNYIAMAHPFFRRGFCEQASFAPRFIELFWKFEDENIDSFIALDADRVRIDVKSPAYIELDTWYGASFKKEIQKIPNGLVKLKPPFELDEFDLTIFFKDVYSLDIKWSEKNGVKTFQAEELKSKRITITRAGEKFHPVRYVHAEYDLNKGIFRHFDGALHLYNEEEYFQRRDSDMNFNEKIGQHLKATTFKVFKMNGTISVDTWQTFTSHFFAGNPLVFEYFEGQYPEHIQNVLNEHSK